MQTQNAVLISDLSEGKTTVRVTPDDWQRIPYACRDFSGVMLMAHGTMTVPDVTVSPGMLLWHRTYTGMLYTVGEE